MNVYEKLNELNLELPPAPPKGGIYKPAVIFSGNLLYTSGIGPLKDGGFPILGKLGEELSVEDGQEAARIVIMNLLSVVQDTIGDLNKIEKFVKMLAFVASSDGFHSQPQVVNGASQLLVDIFGDEIGVPARSAIGTNSLPGNIPVEIEMLIELKEVTN